MLARFFLGIVLAVATTGWRAEAQTPTPQSTTEGWHGSVTPYGWFAGISGTATVRDRSASGSADFGDILNDLKFAAMLRKEHGGFILHGQEHPIPATGCCSCWRPPTTWTCTRRASSWARGR